MAQTVKLKSKQEVAFGTTAFYFTKPAGFNFKPGQYLNWTLINPPETDAEGDVRSFSLASAPEEPDLMIASRMRDTAFKRTLRKMSEGDEIQISEPMGALTISADVNKPAVLIAGGIGITPFRSIVVSASRESDPRNIFLFYANHRPEDAAFLSELEYLEKTNPHYKLIATMTDMARSQLPWSGETGHINAAMLQKYVGDLSIPVFYLAGPPAMVGGAKQILLEAKVGASQIRTEEFTGY